MLGLSSSAAPDLALHELVEACARRGLAGLELAVGEAHGIGPDVTTAELVAARRLLGEHGVRLLGYRVATLAQALAPATLRLSIILAAPVLMPAESVRPVLLRRAVRVYRGAGARLVLLHGSCAARVGKLRDSTDADTAEPPDLGWEVRPGVDDLGDAREVIDAAGDRLGYVLLHGGGPESVSHTGLGLGSLMGRLALARFAGPLVLTPSSPAYHTAWSHWLRRRGGWGCGSKDSDETLVQLSA